MSIRYKGSDQIFCQYLDFTEANYGDVGSGVYTLKCFGYVYESPPTMDPELRRVNVLRNVNPGIPITLAKSKENVKATINWLQPTMAEYVQKNLFTDWDNLWVVWRVYRDAGTFFYIDANGMKPSLLKVSSSIGEDIKWSLDMVGQQMRTPAALPGTPTIGSEPATDRWSWADCYLQYDSGSGLTLFPDVTDFEISIDMDLKPGFVHTDAGTYQLQWIELCEKKPTATITANLQDETWFDAVLNGTEVDLKLVLPDAKYITLLDGKFKDPGLSLKPEDLLAQRLQYEAKSWTHGFT